MTSATESALIPPLSIEAANQILADNFAPWVQALGLRVLRCAPNEAELLMPFSKSLVRVGGTICGQALMSAADTAMVIAIAATRGGFVPMATVNQTVAFLRPITGRDVLIHARVTKSGKMLAFGDIQLRAQGEEHLAVHATTTYAFAP